MISNQSVSISELGENATYYVKRAKKTKKPQYIFINNKPQAMIVDLDYGYEGLWVYNENWIEYVKPYPDEVKAIEESEKDTEEWIEGFSFLNSMLR